MSRRLEIVAVSRFRKSFLGLGLGLEQHEVQYGPLPRNSRLS